MYVLDKGPAKNKLSDRSLKGIFVGYLRETKGYRIWLPESKTFIIARDVKFIKDNISTTLKNQQVKLLFVSDLENKNKPWIELVAGFQNKNETETIIQLLEEDQEDENSSRTSPFINETLKRIKGERRGRGKLTLVKTGFKG